MPKPFEELVKSGVDLQLYNTLNISAKTRYFAEIKSVDKLQKVLSHPESSAWEIFVLGGGSNVLFADDFGGLILHVEIKRREIVREHGEFVWVKFGAGENWHETVRYCINQGWGGIENLSLIPGTVGAAPIQNIGAYGVELTDVFESLEAVHIKTGQVRRFDKEDCRFGYRDSIFKNELKGRYVITDVVLRLTKEQKHELNTEYGAIQSKLDEWGIREPSIRDISDVVIDIRNSKLPDPQTLGNAGSFFKNPIVDKEVFNRIKEDYPEVPGYPMNNGSVKVPAGWLIEETGWKGKVIGSVGTYEQQALVIVNHGGATGKEILQLAGLIRQSVEEEFGIELVPEVNIVS